VYKMCPQHVHMLAVVHAAIQMLVGLGNAGSSPADLGGARPPKVF